MATSGKGCIATNGTVTYRFESRTEAAKWLIAEGAISFSAATVAKKIAAAIRDNTLLGGYRWSADNSVPPLVENYNMRELVDEDERYWSARRQPPVEMSVDETELYESVAAENSQIAAARALTYEETMGIYAGLYAKLPQFKTIFDARKERGIVLPRANIYATDGTNTWAFNDLGELCYNFKINLGKDDIAAILAGELLRNSISVALAADYTNVVEKYYHEWE